MKVIQSIIGIAVLLLFSNIQASAVTPDEKTSAQDGPVQIWSSPTLSDAVAAWLEDFNKSNPGNTISLSVKSGQNEGSEIESLGFVTSGDMDGKVSTGAWRMVVGREVIVPVMNAKSPYLGVLQEGGLSEADFVALYSGKGENGYRSLAAGGSALEILPLLPDDETVMSYVTGFLATDRGNLDGSSLNTGELLATISRNTRAVGFCRFRDLQAFNETYGEQALTVIPIDLNGDNMLDHFENIYGSSEDFAHGIWIGKYPRRLYTRIYAVSATTPASKELTTFLSWLITDGQAVLTAYGFDELSYGERQSSVSHLQASSAPVMTPGRSSNLGNVFLVVLGILAAGIIVLTVFARLFKDRSRSRDSGDRAPQRSFNTNSIEMPGGVFFDRSHTWAFMEKDGYVKTGIDDFLLHATGKITRVKMKRPGESVNKGEIFMSLVQDGKQIDILSPVTGFIKESNPYLQAGTYMLNSEPLNGGWLYRIEPSNWMKEIRHFLLGDAYREWIGDEYRRLKDFLVKGIMSDKLGTQLALQDGGEIREGVLENFGPEVWEEFQVGFINLVR